MSTSRLLLQTYVHKKKNKREKLKEEKDVDCLERGIDTTDDVDDDHPSSSFFNVLFYWGLFELIIVSLVLLSTSRKNYGKQVIGDLCKEKCSEYVTNGLIIRLLLALYLTLGAFSHKWTLCIPWILIDSFGFFPLIPIITSAFIEYTTLWNELKFLGWLGDYYSG